MTTGGPLVAASAIFMAAKDLGSSQEESTGQRRKETAGMAFRRIMSEAVPFFQSDLTAENKLNFSHHYSDLRDGILVIEGDGQSFLPVDHELMTASRIRSSKAKSAQASNEIASPTRCQPAHGQVPC